MQRKLAVGAANDPLEAEADRVAEDVMSPSGTAAPISSGATALRRQCACEGSGQPCEDCAKKKETVQRKCAGSDAGMAAPAVVDQVLQSPGQPLDAAVRSHMEPRFQADFSRVRVHTDERASESARAVNALAYTVGNNLVFASGQYQPRSRSGSKLLAHELTHVLQQNSGSILRRTGCGTKKIGNPEGCEAGPRVFTPGSTFRFNVDCDTWSGNARKGVEDFAKLLPSILNVQIDAYASVDGPEAYNVRLACARAHEAKAVLMENGIAPSRITRMIDHGPTPGNAADRRSVVLSAVTTGGAPQPNTPAPGQNQQQPNTQQNQPQQNEPQKQPNQNQPAKQPQQNQPQKQPPTQPSKQPPQNQPQGQGQGQNPPARPATPPDPLLVFQLPITPLGAQLPLGGPGGIGSGHHLSTPSSAYYQVYQPNIAAGLVLNSRPNDANQNVQLGGFVQIGENFPLPGTSRPLTQSGNRTILTGTNAQAYLQPSVVFYNKDGTQFSVLLQPGVARTFASRVAGENGTTVNLTGGVQWTQDIVPNRWQFFLTITGGAAGSWLDSPAAGQSSWQGWQPFIGLGAGIQFVPPLINYSPR